MSDFVSFKNSFNDIQLNGQVLIRFTKERNNEVIQKETEVFLEAGKLYVAEFEQRLNKREIKQEKIEITAESIENEHAYLANLFSKLFLSASPKPTTWQDFKASKSKMKWLTRFFLLDTFIVGGLVGRIIAFAANKENPHYKTVPSQILGETLGPLIFPAGFKKPTVLKKEGIILLDPILHKQYKALKNFKPFYNSGREGDKTIHFEKKPVPMDLRGEKVNLDTCVASNHLVQPESKDHLHVIYYNGNSGCYQQEYKAVAEDLLGYAADGVPVTAVQFNYPGFLSGGQIKGAPELIEAGIAQVQALLDQGVPPHLIALHGPSLGGSVVSHVGAHFDQLKVKDHPQQRLTLGAVYASRTFASTAQVGRDFFNRALGDNIISRIISSACLPFIKLGTYCAEWDLDTGEKFFRLHPKKRDYSVVITSRKDRIAYQNQLKRTTSQKFLDTILRREKNPADDAILRRGLHDSWERRLHRIWVKWGFYGQEAKKAYTEENRSRKMVVVDMKTGVMAPDVDGHAKASYCYQKDNLWFNPKKERAIGLVHRSSHELREAGAVARRSILKMVAVR